jgi:hypothetical protein
VTGRRRASLPVPAPAVLARAILAPVVLAPAVWASAPAAAQEAPYIEFDMTVVTGRNPFLLPGDDAITTAGEMGARGAATIDVDHASTLALDGRVAYRKYDRRFGSFVLGNARADFDHRSDEHLSTRTGASYERYLPLEGMVASIDAAIDPVSLQERYVVDQDVRWRPDRQTTVTGMAMWSRIAPQGSLLLSRTDAVTLVLSGERRLARFTWIGLESQATFSDTADGSNSRAATVRVKGGARLAKGLTADISLGLATISQGYPGRPRSGGSGQFSALGSICYDPRRFRLCVTGRLAPTVTSFEGIRREKSLNARFDLRLMPRAEFSLEADYRSMPGVGHLADPEVMRASARFQRQIGKYVKLQLGADYDRRTGIASQSLDSWTARIGATFRIPSL